MPWRRPLIIQTIIKKYMAKKYLDKTGLGKIISWVKGLFAPLSQRVDGIEHDLMRDNLLAPACEALTDAEIKKTHTMPARGEYRQTPGLMNGFYAHLDTTDSSEYPLVRVTDHGTQFWIPLTEGGTYTLIWAEMWKDGSQAHEQLNTVGSAYDAVIGFTGNIQARATVQCRTSVWHTLTFTATASGKAQLYFIWNGPAMNCLTVMSMQLYRGLVTGQGNSNWYKRYRLDKLLEASETAEAGESSETM